MCAVRDKLWNHCAAWPNADTFLNFIQRIAQRYVWNSHQTSCKTQTFRKTQKTSDDLKQISYLFYFVFFRAACYVSRPCWPWRRTVRPRYEENFCHAEWHHQKPKFMQRMRFAATSFFGCSNKLEWRAFQVYDGIFSDHFVANVSCFLLNACQSHA